MKADLEGSVLCSDAFWDAPHHFINDLEGQVPKTGELPLATSGVPITPISVWREMGKGERKGRRPMEPLEHLVPDLALNMILFLRLVQQEICSHRKNGDCFSLSLSVVINMLAKATFSLQMKMSHMYILVI